MEDHLLTSIELNQQGMFLTLADTAQGGYFLSFEDAQNVTVPNEFDAVMLRYFYTLYYALLQGTYQEKVGVQGLDRTLTLLLPGLDWQDNFLSWYEQPENRLWNLPLKDSNLLSKVGSAECQAFTHQNEHWTMQVKLSDTPQTTYFFEITNITHTHWCVAITQALRQNQSLTLKVDKSSHQILDIGITAE